MLEPYSPCPCGSGKKFKFCCQPIHASLAKAFALQEQGGLFLQYVRVNIDRLCAFHSVLSLIGSAKTVPAAPL